MMQTVAFIGAGQMGARMARRVKAGGFGIAICDPNPAVVKAFAAEGTAIAGRAADAARSDAVVVIVASDAQIEDVLFGKDGVVNGLEGAHRPIVAIMSTTLPATVKSIATRLEAYGVRLVDAPVSGGPVGAENGTLTILAAGADGDISALEPVFQCMGRNVFRCGETGNGQAVKLVNNMIAIGNIYAVNEAYTLAEKAGLDLAVLGPILDVSTGRTFLSQSIDAARRQYATWAADRRAFDAIADITAKDMALVAKLAASLDVASPALRAIEDLTKDRSDAIFKRWQTIGRVGDA